MKIKLSFFLLFVLTATTVCRGNTLTVITDRIAYTKSDTLHYKVHVPSAACYNYPLSVYITLHNSKQEQVQYFVIQVREEEANGYVT